MTIKLENLLSGSATVDWDSTSMTGTAKRVTEAVELGSGVRDASWQPAWTNISSVLGDFSVEASNDGITWTVGVFNTDFSVIGPAISANSDSDLVQGATLRARFVRLAYTNVSGTGTLTNGVHVNGKRGVRGGVGQTPLTIFGDNLTGWYDLDHRVDGTLPDVTTLINQANPGNGDVTQGTASKRPHLFKKNNRNYGDTLQASQQSWVASGIPIPLWPDNADECTMGWVGSVGSFAGTHRMIQVGDTVNGSGIAFSASNVDRMNCIFFLDTGTRSFNATGILVDVIHHWMAVYDGVAAKLYKDNVQLFTSSPAPGSLMNAPITGVEIAKAIALGQYATSNFRGAYTIDRAPTEAERDAIHNYWVVNSGGLG